MGIYEVKCKSCGHVWNWWSGLIVQECPECETNQTKDENEKQICCGKSEEACCTHYCNGC